MKRFILTTVVLGLAAFTATEAYAWPFGGRRFVYRAAPAPAPVATARAEGGYRTYSYQPAPTYYAPRYFAPTYRGPMPMNQRGFGDATAKALGKY